MWNWPITGATLVKLQRVDLSYLLIMLLYFSAQFNVRRRCLCCLQWASSEYVCLVLHGKIVKLPTYLNQTVLQCSRLWLNILWSISKALCLCLNISEWKTKYQSFCSAAHACVQLSFVWAPLWECCWECVGLNLAPSSLRHWITTRHDIIIHSQSQSLHTAASVRKTKNKKKQINDRLSSSTDFFVCASIFIICTNSIQWHFSISQFYFALYINTIAVNGVICSCNPLVPS